ncbi:MAG: N-acetylglucosamine-6-phosphate deacetylase [Paracoccaceae bacterium]
MTRILTGAAIFDGTHLHQGQALVIDGGRVAAMTDTPPRGEVEHLDGGILAPGLIDLQVNGGGGLMVDGATDVEVLRRICAAHLRLGATGVLPTLITDTPQATARVIAAGIEAARQGVPGFLGLHLEGPHLDPRRKGAHDPALIRPMTDADLSVLVAAARALPTLMVTLAPCSATVERIAALAAAGTVVSLGHADCTHAEAQAAIAAGAGCATHLFNAMSQLGHREPGLVGAVLEGDLPSGLIADGIHVSDTAMKIALAAKPAGLFLVTDVMLFAGTDLTEFRLHGRRVLRHDGRLTLEDGTLAGADLTLPQAIAHVAGLGLPVGRALAMATSVPAAAIWRQAELGHLLPGRRADMVHLGDDFSLRQVWSGGIRL